MADARYKGVRMRKWGKWVSEVRLPNSRQRIWLGSYDTAEKAARAYDAAVFCLRGPGWALNFPDSPPHIPSASSSMTRAEIRAAAVRFANEAPRSSGGATGETAEADIKETSPPKEVDGSAPLPDFGEPVVGLGPFGEPPLEWFMPEFRAKNDDDDDDGGGSDIYQSSRLWNF